MTQAGYRTRRIIALIVAVLAIGTVIITNGDMWQSQAPSVSTLKPRGAAVDLLTKLEVKGRAPKTGYERAQFGDGWATMAGCDLRNIILHRDLESPVVSPDCKVLSGTLHDPYTGRMIEFKRGEDTSDAVQIDHVVALSDAWQKGAQQLSLQRRKEMANDPLELLAVDGKANQVKGDGDAATWLPPNKAFRCQYVARQIAIKAKYRLWVTQAEYNAIARILAACPGQVLPTE